MDGAEHLGKLHLLCRQTWLAVGVDEAFAFFCSPYNLERITPPEMSFRVVQPPVGVLGEGSVIGYRLRLWGLPFRWQSVITDWRPSEGFVDRAQVSPYRHWSHLHEFRATNGGTSMIDRVEYALPLQPLGEMAHFLVRRQLKRIFDFREKAIQEIFGSS